MRRALTVLAAIMMAAVTMVMVDAPEVQGADPPAEWHDVTTTPNAADGFVPQKVWTGERGVVYVATFRSSPTRDYQLLRWSGAWHLELDLPGWDAGPLFGTGPDDIYAAVYRSSGAVGSKLFHFDGVGWVEQTLPASLDGERITSIGGVPGEVQAGIGRSIVRNTPGGWTIVYDAGTGLTVSPGTMTFLAADEAYITSCWGHAWWDGVSWTKKVEFDFCDEADIWGARDGAGDLHLWVTGNNNFQNGVRIWKYTEATRSFGSKYGYEFGDPCCSQSRRQGSGLGIWGASWDDVYVTGYRWNPHPTNRDGKIYHNDGTGWTELTLPAWLDFQYAADVWGTATDDVWIPLNDGRLIHLGPLPAPTYTQVAAGGLHSCAVTTGDAAVCWGSDANGRSTPTPWAITQVSAGRYHSCGLAADGTVECWGANGAGQSTPPAGTFTQVSAGFTHTCGVRTDGTLACWGTNGHGRATPPAGTFTEVEAGRFNTCGLRTDGTLECWGRNRARQSTPPAGTFTQLDVGLFHGCAVDTDDAVRCWGANGNGRARPPAGTFTEVATGDYHTCGLRTDATVECWGRDRYGESTPVPGTYVDLSAGRFHTCGVATDGSLVGWGRDNKGQATPP